LACDWEQTRQRYRELLAEKIQWCQEKRELLAKVEESEKRREEFQENLEKDPDLTPECVDTILKGWLEQYPFLGDSLFECPRCGASCE
jgi:hypothetical protein